MGKDTGQERVCGGMWRIRSYLVIFEWEEYWRERLGRDGSTGQGFSYGGPGEPG